MKASLDSMTYNMPYKQSNVDISEVRKRTDWSDGYCRILWLLHIAPLLFMQLEILDTIVLFHS